MSHHLDEWQIVIETPEPVSDQEAEKIRWAVDEELQRCGDTIAGAFGIKVTVSQ